MHLVIREPGNWQYTSRDTRPRLSGRAKLASNSNRSTRTYDSQNLPELCSAAQTRESTCTLLKLMITLMLVEPGRLRVLRRTPAGALRPLPRNHADPTIP